MMMRMMMMMDDECLNRVALGMYGNDYKVAITADGVFWLDRIIDLLFIGE